MSASATTAPTIEPEPPMLHRAPHEPRLMGAPAPPGVLRAPDRPDPVALLTIVDFECTPHAALMESCARNEWPEVSIGWLAPSHRLPAELTAARCGAVAIPLIIRGANPRDRFTRQGQEAITALQSRGVPVFVAAPLTRRNLLAETGIAVSPPISRAGALEVGGASGACVRAAARYLRDLLTAVSP
jgi:hypothetical protein